MRRKGRVALIGHRGARGLFPENTLEGFAAALGLGLDGVELDVALTADGVPVVSHAPALDPDLTRTEDGSWLTTPGPPIQELRADALARFDVGRLRPGSISEARFPDQTPRDGACIPRLEDALRLLASVGALIELKTYPNRAALTAAPETMAAAALEVAERCDAMERVTFESFDWRALRPLQRLRPTLRLAWLTSAETLGNARLWWDGPHPADFGGSVPRAVAAEAGSAGGAWSAEWADLTEAQIAEAHELGLVVIAWTVNEPAAIARLIRWHVDTIITDRPDIARAVMSELGLSLPKKLHVTPHPAP